jgi:hypothetical protein
MGAGVTTDNRRGGVSLESSPRAEYVRLLLENPFDVRFPLGASRRKSRRGGNVSAVGRQCDGVPQRSTSQTKGARRPPRRRARRISVRTFVGPRRLVSETSNRRIGVVSTDDAVPARRTHQLGGRPRGSYDVVVCARNVLSRSEIGTGSAGPRRLYDKKKINEKKRDEERVRGRAV